MTRRECRPSWRDDRAWQAGILIGSALGAAATVVSRRMERTAREGLVDWPAVERFAIGRLEHAPGTLSGAELRSIEPAYAEAMARIVPALSRPLTLSSSARADAVAVAESTIATPSPAMAAMIGPGSG